MEDFIVSELHATYDFERVIDLVKLKRELEGTPYVLLPGGCVTWRAKPREGCHFSHKAHSKGAFTMKYMDIDREEALAIFTELKPVYLRCLGEEINESDRFRKRNPERFKELKAERRASKKLNAANEGGETKRARIDVSIFITCGAFYHLTQVGEPGDEEHIRLDADLLAAYPEVDEIVQQLVGEPVDIKPRKTVGKNFVAMFERNGEAMFADRVGDTITVCLQSEH